MQANSQITLEHTYTVSESSSQVGVINLSSSGYKYSLWEAADSELKLYNLDHSLWKTINVPALSGFTLVGGFYNISEGLFNLNSQIEYVASYANYSATPVQIHTKIIDENGNTIKDFPNRGFQQIVATASNTYKLILTDLNLIREVYSLPGKSSTLIVPNTDNVAGLGNSFPNPATQKITIPYQLNNSSTTGLINIYDSTGKLVKSLIIDKSFNNIQLDLSNYSPGLYHYNIIIDGSKSISKSFVKN